jgi:hypothetical protein
MITNELLCAIYKKTMNVTVHGTIIKRNEYNKPFPSQNYIGFNFSKRILGKYLS